MISNEHRKHARLARPVSGRFNRNEWAILGAPCSRIKTVAAALIRHLSPHYNCGYVDSKHSDEPDNQSLPGFLASGAGMEYHDLIHSRQLNSSADWNPFQFRQIFQGMDVVLVNGNHHEAAAQVVILSPEKKASLQKRIHQLTRIELFLLPDGEAEVFDFIREAVPGWEAIPQIRLDDMPAICRFFESALEKRTPALFGLVLAGGRSVRMGTDKGSMEWHGKPQREHLAGLLSGLCEKVYISCRPDQENRPGAAFPVLQDTFLELGPFGAILSAFREYPDSAWLVVACDLPLIDQETLRYLSENRKLSSIATAFKSPVDALPEPLIAIWEPKSYPVLLSFLAQGYSCPRKVLINAAAHLIEPKSGNALLNVNTPEDAGFARDLLSGK